MENRIAGHQLIAGRGPIGRPGAPPRIAEYLSCAGLAWGVFAFGTVYAWGYWPLAAVCGAAGMLRLHARDRFGLADGTRELALLLGAVACAALLQVLPLPVAALGRLNPQRGALLDQLDVRMAHGLIATHTLSLDAASTWRALALFVCFGLLMLGVARSSTRGALRIAWFIAWLGIAVALTGIIQKPLFAGAIYGFWKPLMPGTPFGPFINKNHFAGWVVMAIPLALGCVGAVVSHARERIRPGLRSWLLWMSSREAGQALQATLAVLLMGLALALTLSRSGMLSLAAALMVCGLIAARRHSGSVTRPLAVVSVMLLLFVALDWAGLDTVVARFDATDTAAWSGRIPIWRNSTQILADFWGAGSGLNTYGLATLFYPEVVPGHHLREAHNDYLQLAIEGGALLCAPVLLAVAAFIVAVRRRFAASTGAAYWVRLGAVGGLIAVGVQSAVDFSLQMPGNAALFATLCGLALHENRGRNA